MGEGFVGREAHLEDRRMWRLLLARLHPDVGGDLDLFVFAHALRDRIRGELRSAPASPEHRDPEHPFHAWRVTMVSWASRNRDSLRRPYETTR